MKRSHQKITIPVMINGGGTTRISEQQTANIVREAAQQAVVIYKRPSLAAVVQRIKREVADTSELLTGKRKEDFDPLVELAMVAANVDGKTPMEYQLFALDRLRKYWYAELKEADPEGETTEGQKARAEWAKRMGDVLQEYEKRFRAGVTEVEPQIIEPERKKT